MSLLNQQYQ